MSNGFGIPTLLTMSCDYDERPGQKYYLVLRGAMSALRTTATFAIGSPSVILDGLTARHIKRAHTGAISGGLRNRIAVNVYAADGKTTESSMPFWTDVFFCVVVTRSRRDPSGNSFENRFSITAGRTERNGESEERAVVL